MYVRRTRLCVYDTVVVLPLDVKSQYIFSKRRRKQKHTRGDKKIHTLITLKLSDEYENIHTHTDLIQQSTLFLSRLKTKLNYTTIRSYLEIYI